MVMSHNKKLIGEEKNLFPGSLSETSGKVGWASPSNIAIIKYWGKKKDQIPMNPSLSITLDKALTKTTIAYEIDPSLKETRLNFFFENSKLPPFEERIRKFLDSIAKHLPYLSKANLTIHSENTFPHSSGIASSASAMGALALCLCEIENRLAENPLSHEEFLKKASFVARLGSGSAARSVYGKMALWGKTSDWKGSSDDYAIPVENIHPDFMAIRDTILIVESGTKSVSSSAGHALMENNPFAKERFRQAGKNLSRMKNIIVNGDWAGFIEVMENEALMLHAMMMTSNPGYLLIQPATLAIIKKIREFREATGKAAGFTLDAGANVHMLYSAADSETVDRFIESDLSDLCENRFYIPDLMGMGPFKL